MRRYALRDDQWDRIKDILPGREGHVGGTAADDRRSSKPFSSGFAPASLGAIYPSASATGRSSISASTNGPKAAVSSGFSVLGQRSRQRVHDDFRDRLTEIDTASSRKEDPQPAPAAGIDEQPFLVPTRDAAAIILPTGPGARRRRVAGKTIRLRDKEHCKFVASQPCIVCGRTPSETHHIRFAQPRARPQGQRRVHHSNLPTSSPRAAELVDEASWWAGVSIEPLPIALGLWSRSRCLNFPETLMSSDR